VRLPPYSIKAAWSDGSYASDFGEIDVGRASCLRWGGLEIKFFDAVAADHNDPGRFGLVASINILLGIWERLRRRVA